MYHPTERAKALTPISWFYSLYCHTPHTQGQRNFSSRLEISLLSDSGDSISVINYTHYNTIAKLLNITPNDTFHSS